MAWTDSKGYTKIKMCGKSVFLHRLIWQEYNGDIPDGMMVDHIDGDPSNNNINNLRLATRAENGRNREVKPMTNIRKRKNKYEVRFRYEGKEVWVGLFDTIEEAQIVRDKKRLELYGEFSGR